MLLRTLLATAFLPSTLAILPDGLLVPFTSKLPACASLCGKLSDVQGGCVPPLVSTVDQKCFCDDARLSSFLQGPAGVADVCTATAGCSNDQYLMIENWYASFCGKASQSQATVVAGADGATTTTAAGTLSTPKAKKQDGPWITTHWKWIIMFVLVFGGLSVIWLGCWWWRRRYVQRRDAERAMRGTAGKSLSPEELSSPGVSRDFALPGEKGPSVSAAPIASPQPGYMGIRGNRI